MNYYHSKQIFHIVGGQSCKNWHTSFRSVHLPSVCNNDHEAARLVFGTNKRFSYYSTLCTVRSKKWPHVEISRYFVLHMLKSIAIDTFMKNEIYLINVWHTKYTLQHMRIILHNKNIFIIDISYSMKSKIYYCYLIH